MSKKPIPPDQLRKRARESLIVVFGALLFLGIPFAFFLVPFVELAAAIRAQRADSQLTRQGEKPSVAGIFAVPLGGVLFIITGLFVVSRAAEMYQRMKDADEAKQERREQQERERREANEPEPPPTETPIQVEYREALRASERRANGSNDTSSASDVAEMKRAFPYRYDIEERDLERKTPITVAGLELELLLDEPKKAPVLLRIKNTGTKHVAYAVKTTVASCKPFKTVADALTTGMVLEPGAEVYRVECRNRTRDVRVVEVRTIEVPTLAAFHLKMVPPALAGIEERTASQYVSAQGGDLCMADVELTKGAAWRDVVDFFARHDCTKYRFPEFGFIPFERDDQHDLPAGPSRTP